MRTFAVASSSTSLPVSFPRASSMCRPHSAIVTFSVARNRMPPTTNPAPAPHHEPSRYPAQAPTAATHVPNSPPTVYRNERDEMFMPRIIPVRAVPRSPISRLRTAAPDSWA